MWTVSPGIKRPQCTANNQHPPSKDRVQLQFHPLTCFRRYGVVLEISQLYFAESLNMKINFMQLGLITHFENMEGKQFSRLVALRVYSYVAPGFMMLRHNTAMNLRDCLVGTYTSRSTRESFIARLVKTIYYGIGTFINASTRALNWFLSCATSPTPVTFQY